MTRSAGGADRWDGIVLDLDDTLFDTSGILLPAADRRALAVLRSFGLAEDEEDLLRLLSELRRAGVPDVFRRLARDRFLDPDAGPAAEDAFCRYEVPPIRLDADVAAALDALRRIAPLALLTAGDPATQRRKADLLGLARWCSALVFVGPGVPGGKTDALASLCDGRGWRRERVVFAGDRLDGDVRAANRCGCRSVWVRRPGTEFADLRPQDRDDDPWRVVSHVRELPPVLVSDGP